MTDSPTAAAPDLLGAAGDPRATEQGLVDAVARDPRLPAAAHWRGRRVTVMGLGRFGGAIGAVRWLADRGALVTVTDLLPAERLADSLARIADAPGVTLHLGRHDPADFVSADLIVASPAIRPDNPLLTAARDRGSPVTTEVGLLWRCCRGRIIGVTGSAGKSTTAALIHALLSGSGRRAWLGGNIGGSLLEDCEQILPEDWVVLELSSFQLSYLDAERRSPEIAVVTNFAPNHLDWHPSLDEYRWAKQTLLRHQRAGDVAVLNADDPDVSRWPTNGRRLEFGSSERCHLQALPDERLVADLGRLRRDARDLDAATAVSTTTASDPLTAPFAPNRMARAGHADPSNAADHPAMRPVWRVAAPPFPPGPHNRLNAAAAIAAALAAGVDPAAIDAGLQSFRGLPHRLSFVGEAAGRLCYDDSKATTPEAALTALAAFDRPIVLLAGGSDKGADLALFAQGIARHVKAVALMGDTAARLDSLLAALPAAARLPRRVCVDFADAFAWSVAQSAPGDIMLLSPGCASFGWFRDYEDRGEQFREAAARWRDR